MGIPAKIIFWSGKMRRLFEGGYHSRMCLRTWMQCSVFDSIVHGHHVYKTVWTLFSGEIPTASCRHSQSFAPCLRTCSCRHRTLTILRMSLSAHLFEGGYYFALLLVRRSVNLRAATKRGAVSIRANTVQCHTLFYL